MKFKILKIENFLSIGEVKLRLDDRGIVLVTGRNVDNPSITNNGAGKSSIWDALAWCLYGKTLRGVSADAVRHAKRSGGTRVRLKLEDENGEQWTVERTRGVKSSPTLDLACSGNNVSGQTLTQTQAKVEALVGLDFGSFASAILFGQESLRFVSFTDKEKKAVLERLLGLDVYDRAQRLAKQDATAQELVLGLTNASYSKAKERLAELEARKEDYQTKADEERRVIRGNVKETERKIAKHEELVESAKLRLARFETRETRLRNLESRLVECKERHEEVCLKGKDLLDSIEDLKKAKEKYCPTCGQGLKGADFRKAVGALEAAYNEVEIEIRRLSSRYYHTKKRINVARRRLERLGNKASWVKTYEETMAHVFSLRTQVELAQKSKVYSEDALREIDREMGRAREEMDKHSKEVASLEARIRRRKYWERAFGPAGIRSYLLDNVTPMLNERAAAYAEILTNGAISVRFSTVTRLRTGDVIDKFEVAVENKGGAREYAAYSAGERQRIDLCVALALKDLARARSKCRIDLMVFDEVFERLDESGCEKVIELLNKERDQWGSCFVITHNDNLKQFFGERLEVVKSEGVSSVAE